MLASFACFAYVVSKRPDFSPKQVAAIKEAWKSDHLIMLMATTNEVDLESLVESQLGGEKHLSPDYLPVLTRQADSKLLRMRLTQANADLDDETQARILAAAFMKHPGETLLAGIATVNAARDYAKKLEVSDRLQSAEISSFANNHVRPARFNPSPPSDTHLERGWRSWSHSKRI